MPSQMSHCTAPVINCKPKHQIHWFEDIKEKVSLVMGLCQRDVINHWMHCHDPLDNAFQLPDRSQMK